MTPRPQRNRASRSFWRRISCSWNTPLSHQILIRMTFYRLRLSDIFMSSYNESYIHKTGRAITQAVSRRLPAATARVRAQVRRGGICGGKMALGQVLFEYFDFPCQFSFHRLLHAHLSSGPGTKGPDSGRSTKWT
jgi:hypothetical protein